MYFDLILVVGWRRRQKWYLALWQRLRLAEPLDGLWKEGVPLSVGAGVGVHGSRAELV